ncbi:MAG: tetratricopeptide repeat protein [Magnetococcales bacterium]|nr:tetratricopeptide repeat protein [Magnetococcales bacterium]
MPQPQNGAMTMAEALKLALQHHQSGALQEAEGIYRQILAADPRQVDALRLMGVLAQQCGQFPIAETYLNQALAVDPHLAPVLLNLGQVLREMGRPDEAEQHYRRLLAITPEEVHALGQLGRLLLDRKAYDEAEPMFRRALELRPDQVDVLNNLGNLLKAQWRMEEAQVCYEKALSLDPERFELLVNIGMFFKEHDELEQAIDYLKRAEAVQPDTLMVCVEMGNALLEQCRFDDVIKLYRDYLSRHPDAEMVHSNLVITMDHTPYLDDAEIQAERRRWGKQFGDLGVTETHNNTPDPERKLRIGYISGYFYDHSAAYAFAAPILHHNPEAYEVIIYRSSTTVSDDFVTEKFRAAAKHWREVGHLSDDELEALIRKDQVDILIDLSGQAVHNRLRVCARRPAPVQISAWGYLHGTGLTEIDYLFSDIHMIPEAQTGHFAEQIYHLPCGAHLMGFCPSPDVGPLPALKNGYITMGAMVRPNKLTEPVIPLWGEVLRKIPESRFILKLPNRNMRYFTKKIMDQFAQCGVDMARVHLKGWSTQEEHLKVYNEIDFQLDTYPASASITGLESLRMGTPLVAWSSDCMNSRLLAAYMTHLDMDDWVAHSPEEYVQIAIRKAKNLQELADLSTSLRERFDASILGDHAAYALAVEHAYRDVWQRWCSKQITN